MSDCFRSFRENTTCQNANDVLEEFSGKYGLETGSLQRNMSKKKDLTYNFKDDNGDLVEVLCEPHFKINKFDDNYAYEAGVSKNSIRARIYFNFGKDTIKNGALLIGAIGPHV